MAGLFRDYELGGIWEIPYRYEDHQRARSISALAKALLTGADTVLRVDIDEFAVPNPLKYTDLVNYINQLTLPYVTARGMNIILHPEEAPLKLDEEILIFQRNFAHPVGPLNKTCLASVPMDWDAGFHFTTHYPVFDDLFLFHLKHADFDIQMHWGALMLNEVKGNTQFESYYAPDIRKMRGYQGTVLSYPRYEGLDSMYREDFNDAYLAKIRYVPSSKIYHGEHIFESAVVKIDQCFRGFL
jgi:hypothetical protein